MVSFVVVSDSFVMELISLGVDVVMDMFELVALRLLMVVGRNVMGDLSMVSISEVPVVLIRRVVSVMFLICMLSDVMDSMVSVLSISVVGWLVDDCLLVNRLIEFLDLVRVVLALDDIIVIDSVNCGLDFVMGFVVVADLPVSWHMVAFGVVMAVFVLKVSDFFDSFMVDGLMNDLMNDLMDSLVFHNRLMMDNSLVVNRNRLVMFV